MKDLFKCCEALSPVDPEGRERFLEMLRALGNPARLLIVEFLASRNTCMTGEIVDHLPLAQSTVSVHLKVLKEAGWIQGTVEGTSVNYCLNRESIAWFKQTVNGTF